MVVIFQVGSTSEQNAPVSELVKQAPLVLEEIDQGRVGEVLRCQLEILARAAGGDGRSANEEFHAGVQSEVKEEVFHAVENYKVSL
jgi:hypothetical protein